MISIIHPSRSRPKKAYETARKWLENAGCDVEYILSIDMDDELRTEYLRLFTEDTKIVFDYNKSAIDAINSAARHAHGDIICQIADDFDCPPLWGQKIIDLTKGATDWILKTQDGVQEWIITLPIMDRAYYNRFRYIYYPEYKHLFSDTELSCVADLTGRRLTSDLLFKHNHYSVTGEKPDAVSTKADSTWNQGEALFLSRYKNKFGLVNPPGKITNQNYINWAKSKGA